MKSAVSVIAMLSFLASTGAFAKCLYVSPDDITYNTLFDALRAEKRNETTVPENFGEKFCSYPTNNHEGLNNIQLKYYFKAEDYFSMHGQSEINRFIIRTASTAASRLTNGTAVLILPDNTFAKKNNLINKKLRYDSSLQDINNLIQEMISKYSVPAN